MLSFLRTGRDLRKSYGGNLVLAAFAILSLLGSSSCSSVPKDPAPAPPVASSDPPPPSAKPEEALYEQLRSGAFQLSASASSIEDTYNAARRAVDDLSRSSEARSAFQEVLEFLNSAGEGVAEFGVEPPTLEEIAKDFAVHDDNRLKAIESANDSLQDLREALGILEALADDPKREVAERAVTVKALLAVAIDDVWGAIEALGGEPAASDEPLNP